MTQPEQTLWNKVKRFELDDPQADFTFTERLARENSWSLGYATRCVFEYKRFIFLICITDHPLTPSDEVDQVWHLHLLYTESYWHELCHKTLGRTIQHGPTKGGTEEKAKYNDWYAVTKERYAAVFGIQPPEDIWPESAIRFGQIRFTRVNLHKNWVIPKPLFLRKWKF